jgi:hypothetical protein
MSRDFQVIITMYFDTKFSIENLKMIRNHLKYDCYIMFEKQEEDEWISSENHIFQLGDNRYDLNEIIMRFHEQSDLDSFLEENDLLEKIRMCRNIDVAVPRGYVILETENNLCSNDMSLNTFNKELDETKQYFTSHGISENDLKVCVNAMMD